MSAVRGGLGRTAGLVLAALAAPLAAQEALLVRGGTVHPTAGVAFVGDVLVVDGIVRETGPGLAPPAGAAILDATGLHVHPGMFDAVTRLGLTEIGAVDVTNDIVEQGAFNPHLQAYAAVHAASDHIPVARANGITHAVAAPEASGTAASGALPGQGSLIALAGWTVEEMAVEPGVAMMMDWPRLRRGGSRGGDGRFEEALAEYEDAVRALGDWFDAAGRYEAAAASRPDLRLEALGRVLRREMPLVVAADDARSIRDAVAFARERGLDLVLAGGDEAVEVAELLAREDVPVILGPTQSLPSAADAPYAEAYTRPGQLHAAGVRIAFATFNSADSRTLPYEAAMAIPFGLPQDEAWRAVTVNAAEMLGVADRLGTLEPGRIANLIVTDGDPLEIRTRVLHVIIDGREVDPGNRHLELYERYRARPRPGR